MYLKYQPEQFKLEDTTIWSFKERGSWATHKGDYRGNCPPEVPRNLILKYTKEGDIVLDTFCGSGTTMIEAKLLNRKGVGIDINVEALKLAYNRINFKSNNLYQPKLLKANSTNLKGIVPDNSVDFIFAHPPYSNIIKYSNNIEGDLSLLELNEFLNQMKLFSRECFRILKKDKYCAILIGDIRKNKNIIPLGFYIMNIFIETGFTLKEIIIKEQHNCKRTSYWSKNINRDFYLLAHEYIFIYNTP
jgi:DNA modification methylase